jgi:hypothetical protein
MLRLAGKIPKALAHFHSGRMARSGFLSDQVGDTGNRPAIAPTSISKTGFRWVFRTIRAASNAKIGNISTIVSGSLRLSGETIAKSLI